MRQLTTKRKLGLALGAGVSQSAGLPSWNQLLDSLTQIIEQLQNIKGRDLSGESAPMKAQILLSRFRQYVESQPGFAEVDASHREAVIATRWRSLLREALYKHLTDPSNITDPTAINNVVIRHAYLGSLAKLAFRVPVVVTYNFDDLLERALAQSSSLPLGTVGYYPAWGSNFVVQDDRPVVYHPNGFVPFDLADRCSEQVILTEEDISDQIIDSVAGNYKFLFDYYSRCSCLFLGFSLTDPGLRSILRQSARRSPGTVHYYIRFSRPKPSDSEMLESSSATFNLFNMITLYLDDSEIDVLLQLVAQTADDEFVDYFVQAGVPVTYRYYVAGPVSVGKTSVISRLQGVEIVDEWLRPRDPLIAKPANELSAEQREQVDQWILDQLRLKNARFERAGIGLHIMDRAPLDAFAFTPPNERAAKAEVIHEVACGAKFGRPHEFVSGCLVLLTGRPSDLVTRQKWRGRGGKEEYIEEQQASLLHTYACEGKSGTQVIRTEGVELDAAVREAVRAIHVEPYAEFDFATRLKEFRTNGT
jgi:hypothetical protein